MAKRKFKLTDEERKDLVKAYQAVRLYGEGYAVKEIERITGCSRISLMEWCRSYQTDQSQGLVDHRIGGNNAKMNKLDIEALQQTLHQYTPKDLFGTDASTADGQFWTVEDLAHVVQEQYGVKYKSRTSYISLLKLCGFSYQKSEKFRLSRF